MRRYETGRWGDKGIRRVGEVKEVLRKAGGGEGRCNDVKFVKVVEEMRWGEVE